MTKTQFTQGPWITAKADRAIGIFSTGNATFFVAKAYGPDRKANSHLLAAATDLYEALDDLVEMYTTLIFSGDCGRRNPEIDKEVIKARAALAKARGET